METGSPATNVRRDMREEARRIIDAARERGMVLRLLGGLAVREHCTALEFCERDHADLDMIGLSAEARQLTALMHELGYEEERHVGQVTSNSQRQFVRPCGHRDGHGDAVHELDRVDVFLDTFHMDHEVPLKGRMAQGRYTIPVTDVLLTKLQVVRHDDKDVRDILTLLKDVEMADQDAPDVVDPQSIALLCAQDWGLYHDVQQSLSLCEELAPRYGLAEADARRVREGIGRLRAALEAAPKSLAWRLRARLGTRVPWHDEVEEQA
jgi:hypothetical protein